MLPSGAEGLPLPWEVKKGSQDVQMVCGNGSVHIRCRDGVGSKVNGELAPAHSGYPVREPVGPGWRVLQG
jgi:hypothetical protein